MTYCRYLLLFSLLVMVVLVGCDSGPGVDPDPGEDTGDNSGETTPSSIPDGDYPPIPIPETPDGTNANASDTVTTIMPLATDFNPRLFAVTGRWVVGQAYAGSIGKREDIRTCFFTVFSGTASSDDIVYPEKRVDCPIAEGGAYSFVEYPAQGNYIRQWLADNERRAVLVKDGEIVPSGNESIFRAQDFDGGPFGKYIGDMVHNLGPRHGCVIAGKASELNTPCPWWIITNATVIRKALSSIPHIRRDLYWEKAGGSAIIPNRTGAEGKYTFSRTWTEGTAESETKEFGQSVSSEAGLSYQGLGVLVSGTLSKTFGTEVTVSEAKKVTESFEMTVRANTTAVFEVWNLTERYRFVNADGTPFEDPNYRFNLNDLTRHATIATAWTSTEFPID